jgi:hypothetical protein
MKKKYIFYMLRAVGAHAHTTRNIHDPPHKVLPDVTYLKNEEKKNCSYHT